MKEKNELKGWELKKYSAYLIKVNTTNTLKDTFEIKNTYFHVKYYDCEDGEIVVLTDDLRAVIETIGEDVIKEIKKIGIGYLMTSDELEIAKEEYYKAMDLTDDETRMLIEMDKKKESENV